MSIEDIAIRLIRKYEKGEGREAFDVRKFGRGYDIESIGELENRYIEVKSLGKGQKPYTAYWIYPTFLKRLGEDVDKFYLYIVYYKKDKPYLRIVTPDKLLRNLQPVTVFEFRGH